MKLIFLGPEETTSTKNQSGKGSENHQLENSSDLDNLAQKVAEKLTAQSSFTNLWRPSSISSPTVLSLATPSTAPPLQFENKIEKLNESTEFGK